MAQGWTVGPAPAAPSGWTPGPAVPDFTTTNEKDASGDATVSAGVRFLQNAYEKSPLNLPALFELVKRVSHNPEPVIKEFIASQWKTFSKAGEDLKDNRPFDAAKHALYGVTPGIGPALEAAEQQSARGDTAGAAGSVVGSLSNLALPAAVAKARLPRRPILTNANPVEVAAVDFGRSRGVPVDAATVTGNPAVRGIQALSDKSLGGSLIAERAQQAQAGALSRVGGELADVAHPAAMTPETAGQAIRDALAARLDTHNQSANVAYSRLRALEELPTNRMTMPGKPAPIDGLSDSIRGQLRRIVHELDASGYTPGKLVQTGEGITRENTVGATNYVPRTGGAKVFDDIKGFMSEGANPTRGVVQNQLEAYVAGGPETSVVKAALEVARDRSMAKGGRTVSLPELPPSAMDMPTRLEASRVSGREMGIPVWLPDVKKALQPVYDQMTRQMPVTQQQANPGLKAIQNILEGDDYAPLSQVDRDLSAIKAIARSQGGLAKLAVAKLDAAVQLAAVNAGPEAVRALTQGRQATVAKYAASDVLDAIRQEPVQAFRQATAAHDSGIALLRSIREHAPQTMPQIARAKLDELLSLATERGGFNHADKLYAEWQRMGTQTKRLLFPKAGQTQALDHFFLLAKKLATNPNPSGTGQQVMRLTEGAGFWANPLGFIVAETGTAGLSALLHSPKGVPVLTRAVSLAAAPQIAITAAARTAAAAQLVRVAREAGVSLPLPKAAASRDDGRRP